MTRTGKQKYAGARSFFRLAGPLCVLVGGALVLLGVVDFFSAFNGGNASTPSRFYLAFIGSPLLAVGVMMVKAGFLREIVDYTATESSDGITTAMTAAREGWDSGSPNVFCSQCGVSNDAEASFCDSCGTKIARPDPAD